MQYAVMAKVEHQVSTSIYPDAVYDLSWGCVSMRIRQTESLHVAIRTATCRKPDGGKSRIWRHGQVFPEQFGGNLLDSLVNREVSFEFLGIKL